MGRPKKVQPESTPEVPAATQSVSVPAPEVVTEPTVTLTVAQLNAMIDQRIADAGAVSPIDDTGYWQATCRCQSEIFGCIEADRIIFLDETKEQALRLGKFAGKAHDKRTGKEIPLTYAHLKKPSQYDLQEAIQRGNVQVEFGVGVLPPLTQNDSLDPDKRPFRLKSAAV